MSGQFPAGCRGGISANPTVQANLHSGLPDCPLPQGNVPMSDDSSRKQKPALARDPEATRRTYSPLFLWVQNTECDLVLLIRKRRVGLKEEDVRALALIQAWSDETSEEILERLKPIS